MVPAKGEGEKGGAAVGAAGFRVPSRGEVRLNSARDADRWRPERTRSSCVMRWEAGGGDQANLKSGKVRVPGSGGVQGGSETQSGICWLNSLKKSTQTSPPFSLEAADRQSFHLQTDKVTRNVNKNRLFVS
ncbi:transmembrane protein 267 isoform X3 [Dasypus novemcinctus]|uniref:transmembrane protein 267 isoform X3 n=1 Tax=Dasypus novemcinctus TaxID=9361 RepID=UPI0039C92CB7